MKRSISSLLIGLLLICFITSCGTNPKNVSSNQNQQEVGISNPEIIPILQKSQELSNINKIDEALELLEKAKSMAPDDYLVNVLLGNAYFKKKDYKKALAALEKGVKINDKETTPFFLIGCCYYQFGEYEKAEENLLRYLEKNKDGNAMMLLGLSYARENKKDQAIESLNTAKEMSPALVNQIDMLISLVQKDDYEKFLEYVNKIEKDQ